MLCLAEKLTIANVADLYKELQQIVESNEEAIVIDAKSVMNIDTAVLQLITNFFIFMKKNHRTVTWKECSAEFVECVRLLGLCEQLLLSPVEKTDS